MVVGPDSEIGEPEAELVGGPNRVERLKIARKTVDAIREEIAGREFAPEAPKYSYSSYLDLRSGRVVVQTDAPPEVTERLLKEHPEEIELREETAGRGHVPPPRRRPVVLGRRRDHQRLPARPASRSASRPARAS